MRRLLFAVLLAVGCTSPAFATDQTDVVALVHLFADSFNKGDIKTALGTCAEEVAILDNVPPHAWYGSDACTRWASDLGAYEKTAGMTDGKVSIGKPKHVQVTGDRAYAVFPAGYAFKKAGKGDRQVAVMTFAFHKESGGWRIAGWSWADQ